MALKEQVKLVKQKINLYIKSHRLVHKMEGGARELAVTELKAHLESLNGNQKLMASERSNFVRRDWFDVQYADLSKRINSLELGDKEYVGSRQPVRDIIHWASMVLGSLIVMGIGWWFGRFLH